ncbi:FtsK/SpoIIIE domain-containing protein [Myceligenerans salitolerans]|uniref:FtsK domain-containing protein n=1 Tax=Myceligenerans salitolerans TaxID=1230528 RepID=A0ABS3I811_9MICO|nr:FtsK/SpoIIIE domain-containing protein [Myceligenerans salitolerans]MBO0609141.1 hypothetical protein [Myceligenerans salitolerans]
MTVRVTVHPGEDVELSDGVSPATFREPLAALLRRPELLRGALLADGASVPEDGRAGERPLLPGATLAAGRPVPAPGPAAAAVLRASWMLTRTEGAAAGVLLPVTGGLVRDVRRLIDRSGHGMRRRHGLRLRRGGAGRVLAPPRSSADVTWLLSLLPVLASVGVAVVLRQPVFALFALLGLAAVLPQVLRRRSAPAGTAGALAGKAYRAGPDALLAFAVAAHQASPGTWRAARSAWSKAGPRPGWPGGMWDELLGDGSVAVVGAPDPARAVARAVVADLLVHGRPVLVLGATHHWAWCRWLAADHAMLPAEPDAALAGRAPRLTGTGLTGPGLSGTETDDLPVGPVLVVDHGSPDDHATARRAVARGAVAVVLGAVAGCRTVITVRDRHIHVTGPEGGRRTLPLVGVTTQWAEHYARLLAGARHLGRTPATLSGAARPTDAVSNLPDDVPLGGLHDLDGVAAGVTGHRGGSWAVPLGRTTTGTVTWDLVADGPHLLVAGTTGSGKSELLRALVLGLALQHPPDRLMLGLVDFKGGAGLGPLTDLPHVVGHVTDLDPVLAARALEGIHAELRRRKTVLADHGVADIAALAAGTMPRLVVVVDEFRALADELPGLLPDLARIAAQGRSLGVHLVLATQRPAGAVSNDVRANVTARLALRVTDPLESRDVVDCPDAASLPVARPGRAILRIGSSSPVALQCAHTGPGETTAPVRRATPWGRSRDERADRASTTMSPSGTRRSRAEPLGPTHLVAAIRTAYGGPAAHAPLWQPPLPERVTHAELASAEHRPAPGLLLALGDLPGQQRRTAIRWDPADGNLAVLGRARSGRSTALAALAHGARMSGMRVGTVTPGSPSAPEADLLLVDDLEAVRSVRPGWEPPSGVPVAVSTRHPGVVHSLGVGPRLVMLSRDRADDVALGAPATVAGSGGVPGRAVWCGPTGPVLCQVVLDPALT